MAVEACAVGVPLITPVELRLRPEGRDGDTLQKAVSPELEGVMDDIATSWLKVNGEPE